MSGAECTTSRNRHCFLIASVHRKTANARSFHNTNAISPDKEGNSIASAGCWHLSIAPLQLQCHMASQMSTIAMKSVHLLVNAKKVIAANPPPKTIAASILSKQANCHRNRRGIAASTGHTQVRSCFQNPWLQGKW